MLPAFGWHAVFTQWQFAPVVTAAASAAAAAYLWGAWRVARRHPARPWPWWRTALFLGGLAAVVLATESGIGAYDDVLAWDHMVQHLMLLMLAPPLLVAGQPVTLLLHASRNPLHTWAKRVVRSRPVAFLTWPPFTLAAYCAMIVGAHLTVLSRLILQNAILHNAEHVAFLLAGYLYFLPLLGREPIRWRVSYPTRLFLLFLAMPVDAFTGLVLGSEGGNPFPAMADGRPSWAPSPIDDVHIGGAVMWVGGAGLMFALMMAVFFAWSREQLADGGLGWLESARRANFAAQVGARPQAGASPGIPAQTARADADADESVDDDEHLAAYNAYLARLNEQHDR